MEETNLKNIHVFPTTESYEQNISEVGTEDIALVPFTDAQTLALNSGVTSTKITTYDGYTSQIAAKQDTLTTEQLNAVNSGITSTKVATYDNLPKHEVVSVLPVEPDTNTFYYIPEE